MKQIVIMPGGFHPFHAGHYALYQSAVKAFPNAEVYVAATNDQSERPFPFQLKEKLAKLAGVAPGHFVQVKSPFQAKEITQNYDPEQDVLIFVRSEKDRNEPPQAGGTKKDGSPAYFQPWTGKNLQPFSKHAYIAYLPTVEFGPGITSATQIRKAWPTLNDKRKLALVMSLYPAAQKNPKLAQNVVGMFDQVMGGQVDEGWKDIVAGSALALGALGANAQSMPNINVQQVELANKYYNVLVQRAKEDGIKLDTRTLNAIKAKATDAAAQKFQQNTPQQNTFSSQGSERKVSKDINQFESQGVAEGAPIVVMPRADRLKKPDPTKVRYQGDIVPPAQPPSTEKRGVKGRPGQRPMPKYDVEESKSKAIAQTAKDLTNPPKIMQHRAKRDMERDEQLKGRDIAKRTNEGFGPGYPETYEQENKPFKHKGQYRITDMTSEDVNEEHVYRGNAPGEAVRAFKPKRMPSQVELNRKKGILPESVDYLDEK